MHLYATAFGSVTPYCNHTTSNLMATALLLNKNLDLELNKPYPRMHQWCDSPSIL